MGMPLNSCINFKFHTPAQLHGNGRSFAIERSSLAGDSFTHLHIFTNKLSKLYPTEGTLNTGLLQHFVQCMHGLICNLVSGELLVPLTAELISSKSALLSFHSYVLFY
jgi:hypothetical protein